MPALFGSMSAPVQQSFTPLAPPVQIQKRKNPLFGYLGGESAMPGVNRMQVIGATLKDVGASLDGGGADNLMNLQLLAQKRQQDQAQQAWQAEEQARKRQEWGALDSQTAAINNWVSTLPPDQQMLARVNPEQAQKMYLDAQKPKDPEYRTVGRDFLRVDPDGQITPLYRAPKDTGVDGPSITELRQFGNSYNDDTRAINNDMGNTRAAIPYANAVLNSGGKPPQGFNARMSDIQLLRAAARAQTGPGVLTESEVFGTLSPSLQQEIRRQGAYFNPELVTLTPQDRIALAKNINQGASQAAGDLWRLYDSTTNILRSQNVDPAKAGVFAPEYPHPEDAPALNSPAGKYKVGQEYVGPTGRQYRYQGPGRWKFVGSNPSRAQAPQQAPQDGKPKRISLEPNP